MDFSKEASIVVQKAINMASTNKYEFVTPEMILLMIAEDDLFSKSFEECGGDLNILKSELTKYIQTYVEKSNDGQVEFSIGSNFIMSFAGQSAYSSGCDKIHIRHLLHAIWNLDDSYAAYYLEQQDITEVDLLQQMAVVEEDSDIISEKTAKDTNESSKASNEKSGISVYAPCLNDTLKDVNPLIGREKELERTIQILCRKDKNNPLHIGEPGVGKTAITYGLVKLLQKGKIPEALKGAKVFLLDLGGMLAGTQYRGDFEKRFKKVLSEIGKEEKPIIYIDEIHNLSGAGAVGEGSFDASNILKPYLTDGHIRFIGATTFEEYKRYFEKNKSLVRRFQNIEIKEPSEEETVEILNGLKAKYEKFHGVKYSKNVLEYAVKMSAKYINERYLPDKAIDLIDEAGSYRKLHPTDKKTQTVDKKIINEILTSVCRVPIETVETDDVKGLENLEDRIKSKIFGQDEAITQVVNSVKFSKAGLLEEGKPLASLLFVGPTGVGKTEIAKTLASELGVKLVRFDMSEYGEKHAVAKLIGSPAGYVGYEDGGILTEAVRKNPSCVLLLDEIEKAHADIYNVLLQVMDYATLTDNQGRKADFRNVIIIMTSNAGANKLGKSGIGFYSTSLDNSVLSEAVKNTFQPEFRNRLNKIVVFNSMNDDMAVKVVDKKLGELSSQLSIRKITLTYDEKARDLLKEKGISAEFGAREVDRVIRNEIKPLFVDEILFGKLKNGGKIKLSVKEKKFVTMSAKNRKIRKNQ
ncbi:AAA family ATPase [Butyrivibrio sp. NC3005]|uniref:AAA family ATPase n=1 Tax=Butyrivibrio sp. NC3005 TaxID=1280685 RepID=UPI0004174BEE|nr:AAA family ATPase [Butyrivibrio sp. NC3005]